MISHRRLAIILAGLLVGPAHQVQATGSAPTLASDERFEGLRSGDPRMHGEDRAGGGEPRPLPIRAQTADPAPLFASNDRLEVTLVANLSDVLQDIGDDRSYHPALLTYETGDGASVTISLRVRTRGNFRRRPENCDFPPLRLDFRRDDPGETLFQNQSQLKLVAHCRTEWPEYEQYVLQEYAAYRVFNELSAKSFRVRLMRVTYVDSSGRHPTITRNAFVIEHEEHVAERNGYAAFEFEHVPPELRAYDDESLLYLFQYLIGNIDWNVAMLQNLVLIAPDEGGPFTPVPYDFDLARMIGVHYADQHPRLGRTALRHVLFIDFCRTQSEIAPLLDRFRDRRSAIYALYENVPGIEPEQVRRVHRTLDAFYRTIDDPQAVEREFLRPCRVKPQ